MPSRILPGCNAGGCADRSVEGGAGKCAKHKKASAKAHDRMRGSSTDRGYDYRWQRFRANVLQPKKPLCEDCEDAGRTAEASHYDHVVPLAQGGAKYDINNIRGSCHSCHSRKTVAHDGGLGHHRKPAPPKG